MIILFVILIILAAFVLGLIVLIQNPKGGGLAGNIAGFSTQFMGVKQTTDILEKGTWLFAGIIAVLSLASTMFIAKGPSNTNPQNNGNTNQPASNQQTVPNNAVPLTPGTNK